MRLTTEGLKLQADAFLRQHIAQKPITIEDVPGNSRDYIVVMMVGFAADVLADEIGKLSRGE